MPMFANTNGVLIKVFALLHWSFAYSKLVVAPSLAAYSATTEPYRTTLPMDFNTTSVTVAAAIDSDDTAAAAAGSGEDEYPYRDSRYLHSTTNNHNDMYRWHGITQPQQLQQHQHQQRLQQQLQQQQQQQQTAYNDYAYSSDYAMTSPAAVESPSSHGIYPYFTTTTTTQKPVLRHLKFRPRITKLQVKQVRRGPTSFKDMFTDSDSFEEPDTDFVPLVTLYGSQISRWSTMPTHHVGQYTYGSTQPGKTYPSSFGSTSTGASAATSFGHSGLSFSAGSGSALEDLHESASHHHVPIFSGHHHMHHTPHTPKFDMKKIGILALVKIGLAKLKAFGILKLIFLLLLKLKLFLLAMFIKFVLFLKLLKVLKSLLVPLIVLAALIPLLLALLALPILLAGLAPALYSLITMLPIIPIFNIRPPKARVQLNKDQETDSSDTISTVFDQLLSSTQCVEKIACQLATKKEATLFFPFVNWYLHKVGDWLQNDKISTYVDVYTKTVKEYKGKHSDEDGEQWCSTKYFCEKNDDDTSKELKHTPDRRAFSKILDPPQNYTG
ncbi:uncharacterized protein LOC135841817 [Planococcus citri]|uniref:uncharacterized protein LOC135841817 n=1 Tax=Planococcus citri TaxID=170843 RepID=UPI0031F80703